MRKVDHDLTLIAFVSNENGTLSVRDIVETSWHHASYFARRWMKDGEIVAIGTRRPGETDYRMHPQGMTLFICPQIDGTSERHHISGVGTKGKTCHSKPSKA